MRRVDRVAGMVRYAYIDVAARELYESVGLAQRMIEKTTVKPVDSAPKERYLQTQCWICPHYFDDVAHYSDAAGCEREADADSFRVRIGPTDV